MLENSKPSVDGLFVQIQQDVNITRFCFIIPNILLLFEYTYALFSHYQIINNNKSEIVEIFSYYSCTTAVRNYWNDDIVTMMSSVYDEPKPGYDNVCLVSLKHDGTDGTAENR